nr:tetratricopeptide repeat protein [uncultured Dongia sp.]
MMTGARTLIFLSLLFLAACGSPEEREARHLQSGRELYASGDLVKAILEFRNALQINPTGVEAKYSIGLILEKQGNLAAALSAFQETALQDPNHRDAQLKLGQYALLNGDADNALLQADKLIALDPKRPDGHTMRAAALLMQGKLDQVETAAQAALALAPNDEDALIVLASQRARQKKFSEAEALIDSGLKVHAKSKQLLGVKLKLLRDQGQMAAADDILRTLITIEPDNPRYVVELASNLHKENKLPEAQDVFRQAIKTSKTPEQLVTVYADFLEKAVGVQQAIMETAALAKSSGTEATYALLLARLHMKAEQYDQAVALLEPLVTTLPKASEKLEARVELARVSLMRGQPAEALTQLNAILLEDSSNENALILRAIISFNDRKYDDTIADARSALSVNPNSAMALSLMSQTYLATNERELATGALRSLITVAPDNVDARIKLAGLLAIKSPNEAVQNLDAAIALRPDMPELLVSKAQIFIYSKQWDKGELVGQALLANDKTKAAGHQVLGEAALVRKDYPTAISEFEAALALGRDFAVVGPKLTEAQTRASQPAAGDTTGTPAKNPAEKLLTDRLESNPQDIDALILLADLRQRDGALDEAEDLLRRAVTAAPNNRAPYLNLSLILKKKGQKAETVALLREAAAIFPNDSLVQESLAISYEIAEDYDNAKATYEAVLEKWPGNIVSSNNLAQLIADIWPNDKAELDRARLLVEKYRSSNNATLIDTLGWVQVRLGNADDGAILLEKATSLAPTDQQMRYHYAVALSLKNLDDKAKSVLNEALAGTPTFRGVDDAKKLSETLRAK